jgi:hypothetical protein
MKPGKWYKQGFEDATSGVPSDPPWNPGHSAHANYCDGYRDGVAQVDADIEREARAADRVDGYDRDDLGESPDY